MSRPVWFVSLLKKLFPHRLNLARLTRLPILGSLTDRLLFHGDGIIYLPQDSAIAINQSIDPLEEVVLPSRVVGHFIEQATCHWIMNECVCRSALHCTDYPVNLGCLFLG